MSSARLVVRRQHDQYDHRYDNERRHNANEDDPPSIAAGGVNGEVGAQSTISVRERLLSLNPLASTCDSSIDHDRSQAID